MKQKTIEKMFMAFEEDYYNSLNDSAEYKDLENKRRTAEEVLFNSINRDIRKLYETVDELDALATAEMVEKAFIYGYSISNKLRDESLIR